MLILEDEQINEWRPGVPKEDGIYWFDPGILAYESLLFEQSEEPFILNVKNDGK